MAYFDRFPLMTYDIKNNNQYKLLPDILRRVKLRAAIKSGVFLFDKYDVPYGDKPEDVAFKFYGDPELHWVILMTNGITDPYHDWPKSTRQLQMYINDKYGENVNSIKYYYVFQTSGDTEKRIEVPSTTAGAISVSNYEYEVDLNEEKRSIDLLRNEYLSAFLEEFDRLIV